MAIDPELTKKLEAFETPEWAVRGILDVEILPHNVIDPCCGLGVMTKILREKGHFVLSQDIHDWGSEYQDKVMDWLDDHSLEIDPDSEVNGDTTAVMMNPPFSKSCEFVNQAFNLGVRKVICFQRLAWWESETRREWWASHPPNRIYVCASRATCWRFDIREEDRNSGSTTAHAWFVWERGHPPGTVLGHLKKEYD